ncbi:hypothetical protein GCM10011348_26770 [Marinobacterium nitratireducens]|uniref:Uncharacterized protein n=1 Tax=Marinobacterium nitratireducens TaxID=518897 RepID=A0A918DV58_9GAMM|nr:hypothetical protein GCM10011348_26770 [Marinobacterium nitratireducens]
MEVCIKLERHYRQSRGITGRRHEQPGLILAKWPLRQRKWRHGGSCLHEFRYWSHPPYDQGAPGGEKLQITVLRSQTHLKVLEQHDIAGVADGVCKPTILAIIA